jgi:hypothetical protein
MAKKAFKFLVRVEILQTGDPLGSWIYPFTEMKITEDGIIIVHKNP